LYFSWYGPEITDKISAATYISYYRLKDNVYSQHVLNSESGKGRACDYRLLARIV
jgi:hypothetical protein